MRAKKLEFVVGGVLPANNRSRGHAWFDKVFAPGGWYLRMLGH